MMINKVRGHLYRAARLLGDVQAVRRGSRAVIARALTLNVDRSIPLTYWAKISVLRFDSTGFTDRP